MNEENETPVVSRASITVLSVMKKNNEWHIYLNIKSDVDNETKQSNLLVIVDAKKGNVKDMKKLESWTI